MNPAEVSLDTSTYHRIKAANHEAGHAIAYWALGTRPAIAKIWWNEETGGTFWRGSVRSHEPHPIPVAAIAGFVAEAYLCPFNMRSDVDALLEHWWESERITNDIKSNRPLPPSVSVTRKPSKRRLKATPCCPAPSPSDLTDIPTDWDARREIVIEARELLQEFDVALKYFRDGLLLFGCMTTEAIGQFYQVDGLYDSKPIVGCEIVPTLTFKESRT